MGSVALYAVDPFVKISNKNILPSDLCFLAAALILFSGFASFLGWEQELFNYPGFMPAVIYLAAATLGFILTALRAKTVPEFHVFSVLQLAFIFFCLCPTVLLNKTEDSARWLWMVPMWCIPIAGGVSITDLLGLTNTGIRLQDRNYNVVLQGNAFAIFAAVSPLLLQRMFPFRPASLIYTLLWTAGTAGTILSGSKAGMVIVGISVLFVTGLNVGDIVANGRYLLTAIVLFISIGMSIAGLVTVMPTAFGRFQKMVDFFQAGTDDYSASLRQDQLKIVVRDLESKPILWLGTGLKQYRVLHPDDEIESIHNMYLQQLYESGLIGLIAFIAVFVLCLRRCVQCYRMAKSFSDNEHAKYWACCSFAILSYLLMGFVYPLGYDRQFWLLLVMATPSWAEYVRLQEQVHRRVVPTSA